MSRTTSTRVPGFQWRETVVEGLDAWSSHNANEASNPVWAGHTGFKRHTRIPSLLYPKRNKTAILLLATPTMIPLPRGEAIPPSMEMA